MLRIIEAAAAISDPIRRRVLELVRDRELPAGELAAAFDVSRPAVSRHLRVLREAGLVEVHPDGQRRMYELRAEPLAEIDAWLGPYRRFWSSRLDALERHLDEED
jgi:DNA-binding transcriptional ArsR family regulator